MSSEGISRVKQGFISSTDETSSFDDVMSVIEGWGSEIFIDGMDFKVLERIDGSQRMLPDVSDDVVELS